MDNILEEVELGQLEGFDIRVIVFQEEYYLLRDWLGYFASESEVSKVESHKVIKHSSNPRVLPFFIASEVEDNEQAQENYETMMKIENGDLYHFGLKIIVSKNGIELGTAEAGGFVDDEYEKYLTLEDETIEDVCNIAILEAKQNIKLLCEGINEK